MSGQTAVVVGATGMIGNQVVEQLIRENAFSTIRLLVRKPITHPSPKVEIATVNFDDPADLAQKLAAGTSIFCCVGTTQSKVKGDQAAYRKVDFDLPLNVAKQGLKNGFTTFLLVSAVGANPASKNFYLRLKGETEEALKKLSYPSMHIFQPSLLMGERKEFRITEKIAQTVFPVIATMFLGALTKYKPIHATAVAAAMAQCAKSAIPGFHVYTYQNMRQLAKSAD